MAEVRLLGLDINKLDYEYDTSLARTDLYTDVKSLAFVPEIR